MAVMLRTLGIPSRVVNGFRSDEFNDLTGNYVVRAKDAHSWVEAYFPGYGWQIFDPTPAGSMGARRAGGASHSTSMRMSSFWRDWVVSYDTSHQYVLGQTAVGRSRVAWEGARNWARVAMRDAEVGAAQSGSGGTLSWTVGHLRVADRDCFCFLGNMGRIARWRTKAGCRRIPSDSEAGGSMWYRADGSRPGPARVEKPAAQTPRSSCKGLPTPGSATSRSALPKSTSPRASETPQTMMRLPELYEEVASATRSR